MMRPPDREALVNAGRVGQLQMTGCRVRERGGQRPVASERGPGAEGRRRHPPVLPNTVGSFPAPYVSPQVRCGAYRLARMHRDGRLGFLPETRQEGHQTIDGEAVELRLADAGEICGCYAGFHSGLPPMGRRANLRAAQKVLPTGEGPGEIHLLRQGVDPHRPYPTPKRPARRWHGA